MCGADAPEAVALSRLGLKEGSGNTHLGQGTACRRFFFQNQYLELLWVRDPNEGQDESIKRTRLWDRWAARQQGACPFGLVLRPAADNGSCQPPFPTWAYAPRYLPKGLSIEIAVDTPLTEPEFMFLGFQRGRARAGQETVTHAIPLREITHLRIGTPAAIPHSRAGQWAQSSGLVSFEPSRDYVLRVAFDRAASEKEADLRPELPLVLEW